MSQSSPAARRSVLIAAHVSPAEATAIRHLAKLSERTVSTELRRAMLAHLEKENPTPGQTSGSEERSVDERHDQE